MKQDKDLYQYECIGFYNDANNANELCSHYNNGMCMFFIDSVTKINIKCPHKLKES